MLGGTATWWGSDQVQVRPERRYLKDSQTYRIVQVAAAEVRVKFVDFAALSAWVEQAGSTAGVTINGIEWTVTEQHRTTVQREVRVQVVRDATQRAEAYASAIGSAGVVLQTLWEPGLRPDSRSDDGGGSVTRAMMASGSSAGIELRPNDIEISASVTADFVVEQSRAASRHRASRDGPRTGARVAPRAGGGSSARSFPPSTVARKDEPHVLLPPLPPLPAAVRLRRGLRSLRARRAADRRLIRRLGPARRARQMRQARSRARSIASSATSTRRNAR